MGGDGPAPIQLELVDLVEKPRSCGYGRFSGILDGGENAKGTRRLRSDKKLSICTDQNATHNRVAARGSGGPVDPRPKEVKLVQGTRGEYRIIKRYRFPRLLQYSGVIAAASKSDFIPACHGVYFNPDVAFTNDFATYGGISFESHTRAITSSWSIDRRS
jgi:hypothetical protein